MNRFDLFAEAALLKGAYFRIAVVAVVLGVGMVGGVGAQAESTSQDTSQECLEQLTLYINNTASPWAIQNDQPETRLDFEGGHIRLNAADCGLWEYAHVLGVFFQRTGEGRYRVGVQVRHHDQGWKDYANVWRVVSQSDKHEVINGERILAHPHDDEQPFVRMQNNVQATGEVCIEAEDNVQGLGGSVICLDLAHPTLAQSNSYSVSYVVQEQD